MVGTARLSERLGLRTAAVCRLVALVTAELPAADGRAAGSVGLAPDDDRHLDQSDAGLGDAQSGRIDVDGAAQRGGGRLAAADGTLAD